MVRVIVGDRPRAQAGRPTVAGIDGCRSGWVVATVPAAGGAPRSVEVVADLRGVVAALEAGHLAAAAIDIPIGLPAAATRRCDVEARRLLGPRRSSVFPAPVRAVLAAASYAEACAASRAASGKAVSKQLFNIVAKIRQVDAVMSPVLQERLFEMCPELSFAQLAGAPMGHAKKTAAGRLERLAALRGPFPGIGTEGAGRIRGAQPDDVLDAMVGAWTARRYVAGEHLHLGGERDQRGLRMEIIA